MNTFGMFVKTGCISELGGGLLNVANVEFGTPDYLCRNGLFFKVQQAFKTSNVASVVLIYSSV